MAGFQISKFYFGFRIPLAGFRIPKPWITDSTDQNYLDFGLLYMGRYVSMVVNTGERATRTMAVNRINAVSTSSFHHATPCSALSTTLGSIRDCH